MPSTTLKRRRTEDGMRGKVPKKQKKVKRQRFYHSSSEDEDAGGARDAPRAFAPVSPEASDEEEEQTATERRAKFKAKIAAEQIASSAPAEDEEAQEQDDDKDDDAASSDGEGDIEPAAERAEGSEPDDSDGSEASSLSETWTSNAARKLRKRNDPEAFATSISKILHTKLTTQKRAEPILSRSKSAQETNKTLSDHKLTQKAHRQLLAEKKAAQEKGRVKDVLGLHDPSVSTAETTAKEKELRRTAQKGVIKLFNAVRAAQVKGEQAEREARERGMVGMAKREEKVKEMSKQGFLDMITGSATKKEGSVEA